MSTLAPLGNRKLHLSLTLGVQACSQPLLPEEGGPVRGCEQQQL